MVALVSYPQTGSTWVRHLVEKATGIYTGTIYDHEKVNAKAVQSELKIVTYFLFDLICHTLFHFLWINVPYSKKS